MKIYDMEISPELISQITNSVIEEVRQWQNRPLDDTYPIVYMDCIQINMKNELVSSKNMQFILL